MNPLSLATRKACRACLASVVFGVCGLSVSLILEKELWS